MRILFIIQGEGNGHFMQAVALKQILEKQGYELAGVFQGASFKKRCKRIHDKLLENTIFFISPFFVSSNDHQGLNIGITFILNILLTPVYIFEIFRIGLSVRKIKPDLVINFYDLIGGLSLIFAGKNIKKIVISHHFFFEHPDFRWPEKRKAEKKLLQIHSFFASFSADKKLALSFTAAVNIPEKRLFIVPPLLRNEIIEACIQNGDHIHIYSLYPGYYHKLVDWCAEHSNIKIKMFSDFSKIPVTNIPNLEIYSFSTGKFISSLISSCRVICTAGFETLAEAAFLGKPLDVAATKNHFEQYCNAVDLERSGLGKAGNDILPSMEITKQDNDKIRLFREWVLKAEKLIISYLEMSS